MGTDCTIVIERNTYGYYWDVIGLMQLPRCYDLFADIRAQSIAGYPPNVDEMTTLVLGATEEWGECYMSYKEFKELMGKYDLGAWITIKKKYHNNCRVIARFDC